jgi:hypothetical protein
MFIACIEKGKKMRSTIIMFIACTEKEKGNHASPTKPKTSLLCLTSGPIAKLGTISR